MTNVTRFKRRRALQDPTEVINKYGADALRLYLINSPVVRAETLRFKEEGVFSVVKDVFLPWYNAYRCAAGRCLCVVWLVVLRVVVRAEMLHSQKRVFSAC
jgi:isoleucyl-tRNA synthetase